MKKKKVVFLFLAVGVIAVAIAVYFIMIPDVRNRPLTTREHMLLNLNFSETVELFEVRRGEYELHLYHYHFGERIEGRLLNPILIFNRTGMIAFYSEKDEDGKIGLGMRTESFHDVLFLEVETEEEEYSGMGWGPVGDSIQNLRVGDEQVLMTYQIDSGDYTRTVIIPASFSRFEELIENMEVAEHIVLITITRVE